MCSHNFKAPKIIIPKSRGFSITTLNNASAVIEYYQMLAACGNTNLPEISSPNLLTSEVLRILPSGFDEKNGYGLAQAMGRAKSGPIYDNIKTLIMRIEAQEQTARRLQSFNEDLKQTLVSAAKEGRIPSISPAIPTGLVRMVPTKPESIKNIRHLLQTLRTVEVRKKQISKSPTKHWINGEQMRYRIKIV
jgi:hypothetical protein